MLENIDLRISTTQINNISRVSRVLPSKYHWDKLSQLAIMLY